MRAVILDIGGVLELTPRTGWERRWAVALGISTAELDARLDPIWRRGETGEASLSEIERATAAVLGLDDHGLAALMADAWAEYLGTLNHEMVAFVASLRPRYRIGLLSNSFAGGREREVAAHGFDRLADVIVYSHETGLLAAAAGMRAVLFLDTAQAIAALTEALGRADLDGRQAPAAGAAGSACRARTAPARPPRR